MTNTQYSGREAEYARLAIEQIPEVPAGHGMEETEAYTYRLFLLRVLRDTLETEIAATATEAHDNGVSWSQIGEALAVTKQAVQQRYGRD